jgi:protocatechuate 3,4-dioxygenase beta subunit
VTQIYVEGEPRNDGDFIFRGIPEARRPLVLAAFVPAKRPGVELEARIDLVIGATPGEA